MVRLLQQRHVLRTTPIAFPAAAELVSTFYYIFFLFIFFFRFMIKYKPSAFDKLSGCSQFTTKQKRFPPILYNIWGQAPADVL